MKKTSILFILLLLLSIDAFSQKSQPVAYAVFKDSTLTFYYGKKKPQGAYYVEKMVRVQRIATSYYTKEWDSVRNKIKTVVFDKSFKKFCPKSCSRWFAGCENLTSVKGIEKNLNTSTVTDMNSMFLLCKNLTTLDVSGFNTDNVTNMEGMFRECANLSSLDISGFNTDKVTDMSGMFDNCNKIQNLDLSGFHTDNVADMSGMFNDCKSLTSLDISGFNTEKVANMMGMFMCCENIKTIYVGNGWNTVYVTDTGYMFYNCQNIIGGQGTKYNPSRTDASYAHIDGGESNPGYLTKKTK